MRGILHSAPHQRFASYCDWAGGAAGLSRASARSVIFDALTMQFALRGRKLVLRDRSAPTVIRKVRKRKHSVGLRKLWPNARTRRRWLRAFKRLSRSTQLIAGVAVVLTLWLA